VTDSRERILRRIREGILPAEAEAIERPGIPEIWPPVNAPPEELFCRFQQELAAVQGEACRMATAEQAKLRLRTLAEQFHLHVIGFRDSPVVRPVIEGLPAVQVREVKEGWTPQQIATLDAAVIPGEIFLADTGSAVLICPQQWQRLLCYLPPACVIVGYLDRLYAHMGAAWPAIAAWAQDSDVRGEFVIVTGPSRTSDIEKVLTLGVHGPKQLWVFLLE
jgi:L-lactate dehydrogenase complex protein LldG